MAVPTFYGKHSGAKKDMIFNEELRDAIKELYTETVVGFRRDGADIASVEFLSEFSYGFIPDGINPTRTRIVSAAFREPLRQKIEQNIKAFYANSRGLDSEGYLCEAVDDFLNYIIPRAIELPDEQSIFDERYEYFDQSLYGDSCLVTLFSVLGNVSDHSGRVTLPQEFDLKYLGPAGGLRVEQRAIRDRVVPCLEIKKRARPIGVGRAINSHSVFFVFEHSSFLRQNESLVQGASRLRDEITKKFILATRLIDLSAAFSDYRGYRMLGALSGFNLNLLNFPDEFVEGQWSDLSERDSLWLGRLMPRLAAMKYDEIYLLDTKLDDILRRARRSMFGREMTSLKVAVEQLIDCFQIFESVLEVSGSEAGAVYAAALLKESGYVPFLPLAADSHGIYKFVKRMFALRNDVMHGRIDKVLHPQKLNSFPTDVHEFRRMVCHLAILSILNGKLKESATRLAVGAPVHLDSLAKMGIEEKNALRKPKAPYPSW